MSVEQRPLRKARRTPKGTRRPVTRAEFDRVIDILNERGQILNDIRRSLDIQFKRIAQIQVELDAVRRSQEAFSIARKRR
jgi:hypothetical protein